MIHVWELTPVADRDDPAWQGRTVWARIRVTAANAGEALALAAEATQMPLEATSDGQLARSGVEDTRLYRLDRKGDADGAAAGILEIVPDGFGTY
jgi:hypothetical protein